MSGLWSAALPTVTVPRGAPKPLTLIVPYYAAPVFFQQQQAWWQRYPDDLRAHLAVIVVDDGSPVPAALEPGSAGVRLFRIEQDVPWNWLAARNIGAAHAADGWLLLTDMDHRVPVETLDAVIHGQHDPACVYAFRRRTHTGAPLHSHSASFLMTRALFWRIGGYDERLSGVYGTDGLYRRRLARLASLAILPDVLVRYEFIEDASVTCYARKTVAMRRAKAARLATLRPGTPPLTLSFPYHEVGA